MMKDILEKLKELKNALKELRKELKEEPGRKLFEACVDERFDDALKLIK